MLFQRALYSQLNLPVELPPWGQGGGAHPPPNRGQPPNLAGPQIVATPPKFSRSLDTLWSIDSQKKVSKFDAVRCQILRIKCTKFDFCWGFAPDPAGGAYTAPPDPVAVFNGA